MKKFLICSLITAVLCVACVGTSVRADYNMLSENANTNYSLQAEDGSEPTTRGLYTHLTLTLNCGDRKVWATVKNDFTLFPSTVMVYVELYSSVAYSSSYTDMSLVARKTVNDLDMGDSLTVEASTSGIQQYWIARMCYKIDKKDWETKTTKTFLIDGEGNHIVE